MTRRMRFLLPFVALLLAGPIAAAADAPKGYQAKVKVGAETRLDWSFVVSNRSLPNATALWLGNFDATKQQYELFVPPNYNPKQSYPVVLFVAPGNEPGGWKAWEPVCKKEGVIFAAPYRAGNDVNGKDRIRIVLDVLDDVRRNYNTDPDRTYITGFSGGGRIAFGIAFALPECFGGVLPVCAAGEIRKEPWLRQRVVDRLSVGFLTGDGDFNRGECERYRGPLLKEVGVRTKVWMAPNTGHAVPAALLPEAFQWLEEGVGKRREFAKLYPASRSLAAPTREKSADLLLKEGKERLTAKETVYTGLMQLKGCLERWSDLPAAAEAKQVLLEYDGKAKKPWEDEDIAEQLRYVVATARGLSGYATGPLPEQYAKQRPDMAKEALKLWAIILEESSDEKVLEDAKTRVPELVKIVKGEDK